MKKKKKLEAILLLLYTYTIFIPTLEKIDKNIIRRLVSSV